MGCDLISGTFCWTEYFGAGVLRLFFAVSVVTNWEYSEQPLTSLRRVSVLRFLLFFIIGL